MKICVQLLAASLAPFAAVVGNTANFVRLSFEMCFEIRLFAEAHETSPFLLRTTYYTDVSQYYNFRANSLKKGDSPVQHAVMTTAFLISISNY